MKWSKVETLLTVNSSHDEADLGGVGGAGKVGVDLFGVVLIQAHEAVENVVASLAVVVAAVVVGEVVVHGTDWELLLEAVNLVEEEDDGRLDEPARVADGVKQGQGFLHAVDSLVLKQELVVLGDGDKEEDGGDVFEAVNPLFAF